MMKKIVCLSLFFNVIIISIQAQFNIFGQLKDTINEPVAYATVMLLNPKDSTLSNFTASDTKGNFAFKNIRKTDYILKISHFNCMPQHFIIQPEEAKDINLGTILMKPIAHFLMEVVIKEARAPIYFKGDTVEYDATTFKVPPGSTVEDLLRKLPGVDVDVDGNISTMGRDVRTVYVDGKSFFGNNPKTVTQNLDAQAVSKVQIFSEKSEQEKITGIADGSKEKVMNLELKEEYKKGYFGKATAGYGWGADAPHRWIAKGNFNWFTDKQQLSFIGYGNNLNQSGMDWGDMQDFYGQSMQSGRDNGDFGFGSSMRGYRYFSFSNHNRLDGGFSNNGGGGINYNYYNKKIKFNAGYFYSLNQSWNDVFSSRQTFLKDSTFWRIDTASNNNLRQNHSFSTRFENEIDSSNKIVIRANVQYSPNERTYNLNQLFQNSEEIPINLLTIDNLFINDNFDFNILTLYDHKFKKKGRTFAVSGYYNYKTGNDFESIHNVNRLFYQHPIDPIDEIKFLVENNKNSIDNNVKSSLLYVEPLGKRFSLMGFYNFRNTLSKNNNSSENPELNKEVDSLWLHYRYNTLFSRAGASANYAFNGINLSLGGAFQSLFLSGSSETKPQLIENFTASPYNNFIPYFSANLDLPKNFNVNASYSYDVSEPRISYLFPMPNLTNSLYKIRGNPNLSPERYHEIEARAFFWKRASMVNLNLSGNATFYDSQIIYNQTTEFYENQGYVTVSTPDNVKGGNRFRTNFWTSFPIVKTKLTMNISGGGNISNAPIFINSVENITNSKGYNASVSLNLTLGQKLNFSAGSNASQTFTKYSIQIDRNQNYTNFGANVNGKWQVLKKTFLEGGYRFSNYSNSNQAFEDISMHLLNLSVRQVIGKNNQWELRLAANDILDHYKFIVQTAFSNYIEFKTSPTLARYFLLTASYNIKGFETKNSSGRNYMVF
ncbi:MAG: TonB-dependent receptor [Bacteroidales bacterium]|jgi:hypothetical protein|nr:TonB-dependent receptor [Bacteroidales bacterium]